MSSLYPSLEDMQVDKIIQAQNRAAAAQTHAMQPSLPAYTQNPYPELNSSNNANNSSSLVMYPNLGEFMGLDLSEDTIRTNMPEYLENAVQPFGRGLSQLSGMVAPLSGNSVGLQRGQVTNGIRELVLCKGADKKVGLRVKDISNGVFVTIVVKDSPAALAGLRFGDQILQINGTIVAGYSMDKIHDLLKKSPKNDISIIVRDRPFERAITLHKDSKGRVGFQFSSGKITSIVKDSTAAKNGLLIDHNILEINGQNVVGMKDKDVTQIIDGGGQIITLTIIPSYIYDHMMKKLSSSFIRGIMDHSAADF
ncbi:syntenin-1-like [Bradysia coprophila]|uniref:syntenin-1-like n=1 Tax=Bradysia coprophila TaxID=38358 RepID=UPI00187DAAB5|nr:syntenin-1-like [Bradysia coprophila]